MIKERHKIQNKKEVKEVKNRARAYLSLIFNQYGKTFFTHYLKLRNEGSLINVYARDLQYEKNNNVHHLDTPLIYVKYKGDINIRETDKIFKSNKYYKDSYFGSLLPKTYIYVFRIPEEYYGSYYRFLESQYSKMYTPAQIKALKIPPQLEGKKNPVLCVLQKDPSRYDFYVDCVKKRYGVSVKDIPPVEELTEYDLPIQYEKDFLNYKKEIKEIKE